MWKSVKFLRVFRCKMGKSIYPPVGAMTQAVPWCWSRSLTVEFFIAKDDWAGNEKETWRPWGARQLQFLQSAFQFRCPCDIVISGFRRNVGKIAFSTQCRVVIFYWHIGTTTWSLISQRSAYFGKICFQFPLGHKAKSIFIIFRCTFCWMVCLTTWVLIQPTITAS